MRRYLVRRLVEMLPVLFLLSVIIFTLLRLLPGDPVSSLLGPDAGEITESQREAIERRLGLDQPLPVQYIRWAADLLQGEWGRSFIANQPVSKLIRERLGVTLQVATLSWLVALALGVPIGVVSALRRNSWLDVAITSGALAGLATPNFVLGLLLIVVFGVYLHALPTNGFVSLLENPVDGLRHLVLPTVALATGLMVSIIRQTRSAMLEVLHEDYIRTARAKGLPGRRVILGHALKNALLPVVTIAGLQIGNLASGTIIIESIFSIPGMGSLTIQAIYLHDFATVQVLVLILAVFTISANFLADVTYTFLDPRIRLA